MNSTSRILAVLLVLGSFAVGHAQVVPTFFGIHTSNPAHWPATIGALGKASGVNWVYSEPSRGVFNWSNLDFWVNAAQNRGVSFIFSNDSIPAWAVSDLTPCVPVTTNSTVLSCREMVTNIQDWDDFVTALAKRYQGKLIYELWNEPSINGTYLTVQDMITLTNHEYSIIRAIAPSARILCCGFAAFNNYSYMSKFFAAGGGPRGVNAISFHGNFRPPAPPPEWTSTMVDNVRAILAQYGFSSSKPIWDTEGGWAILDPPPASAQPAFIAKWYLLQLSKGVSRSYWYGWDLWRPLWTATQNINAAGVAYQQVFNWTVGASMSPCRAASDGTTWTCALTRTGGYQGLIIWNSAGQKSYTPASQYTRYRNLAGSTVTFTPGQAITIGLNPRVLETFTP